MYTIYQERETAPDHNALIYYVEEKGLKKKQMATPFAGAI